MSSPVLEPAACICTPYRGRDVHDADCPQLRNNIPRMTMHDALQAFEAIRSSTRVGEAAHGIASLAVQQIRAHGGDGVPSPAVPADQRPARPLNRFTLFALLHQSGKSPSVIGDEIWAAIEADRAARPPRDVQGEGPCPSHCSFPDTGDVGLCPCDQGDCRACDNARAAAAPLPGKEPRVIATYALPSVAPGNGLCDFCEAEVPFAELQSVNQRGIAGLVACAKCNEPAAGPLPEKEPPR